MTRDQLISLLEGKLPDAEGERVVAELRALPESASFSLNARDGELAEIEARLNAASITE